MALFTGTILVTGYVTYRYVRKRRQRSRKQHAEAIANLDPAMKKASMVVLHLTPDQADRVLVNLPESVLASLNETMDLLPEQSPDVVERAVRQYLSHFTPPLDSVSELNLRGSDEMVAALLKLIVGEER